MKTLLDFNLTAKKPLPCVVETSGHMMSQRSGQARLSLLMAESRWL